jgi:glutathione S-transferase
MSPDNLIVYQLAGGWGLPSISPFCLKLEAYLRLVDLPFKSVVVPAPFGGPKRKAPWIEHEGRKIGDSGFIIEYLEQRFGCNPNGTLTPAERAIALALRRLIEENLYWTLIHDRWVVEANWQHFRNVVLGKLPAPARALVGPLARRNVWRQLKGHGMGVHSADEIHAIGCHDIGALADFLADKPYLMGVAPTEIDAIAYGFLANIMNVPIASPVKDYALTRENLVAFLERMRVRYFR